MFGIRTRPEFRSGPVPVSVEFGLVPVRYWYIWPVQDRYRNFFMLYYRFYDELPASRAPSSSLAGSREPLQFPDCITYSPPVSWLYHVLPPIPRLYHVLPSSSQNVSCPNPPLATLGEEYYLYFHRLLFY